MKNKKEQDLGITGMGDIIAKVTDTLGINKCQKCEERQSRLNRLFPWIKTSRDITQEEKELMIRINNNSLIDNDMNNLFNLYNELLNSELSVCIDCTGLIKKMIERINVFIQP